jgi:hypothetical protein
MVGAVFPTLASTWSASSRLLPQSQQGTAGSVKGCRCPLAFVVARHPEQQVRKPSDFIHQVRQRASKSAGKMLQLTGNRTLLDLDQGQLQVSVY